MPADIANNPLVELEEAGVCRGGRWLVRDISLAVQAGEIVTLIGPNGSGKTTTVKMILSVWTPDSGRVQKKKNLKIGYVPQRLALNPSMPMTVARFMQLTAHLSEAEISDSLAETGVEGLAQESLNALSGGEFQRVLLARAIARHPELLVLDEPVQGVDFSGEAVLYRLIGAVRDRLGCGVLLISHDLHLVMAETDRVLCLNGHICCQGTPISVASNPEYRRLFGQRTAAALAIYEHHHDHAHQNGQTIPINEPIGESIDQSMGESMGASKKSRPEKRGGLIFVHDGRLFSAGTRCGSRRRPYCRATWLLSGVA